MNIELSDLNNGSVFIGDKLNVNTKFEFDEDSSILWSGLRLLTHPPCAKELQIAKEEIFSKGNFEAGTYIRERALLIKNNVVPTIEKRKLGYVVKLIIRKPHPINRDEDLIINKTHEINIKARDSGLQTKKANPISLSLSGVSINLSKDIFKPGEAIKVNFTSEQLKQIEVRLLQKANLICYCDAYGQTCRKVEELPPAIAGDARTTDLDKGFLLLKIPDIAEPSHNYLWEPTEKEYWGFKFGDYTKWSLFIIGKPKPEYGRETITFEVPITIVSKPSDNQEIDKNLFSSSSSKAPSLFEGASSRFQKVYKIISIDSDLDKYMVTIKNISKKTLEGVTIKSSGLQEGLFETAAQLSGFSKWTPGEEKEIVFATKQNISALISHIEDNSQMIIRIQSPVSADLF